MSESGLVFYGTSGRDLYEVTARFASLNAVLNYRCKPCYLSLFYVGLRMPGEQGTHIREANIILSIFDARYNAGARRFRFGFKSNRIDIAGILQG